MTSSCLLSMMLYLQPQEIKERAARIEVMICSAIADALISMASRILAQPSICDTEPEMVIVTQH